MKKLLMGIFGLILLLPFGVSALNEVTLVENEGDSVDIDVTVTGELGIYNVDIAWSNFAFEYVYDEENDKHIWKAAPMCLPINKDAYPYENLDFENGYGHKNKQIYKNNSCTEEASEYDPNIVTYYYREYDGDDEHGAPMITILDASTIGKITPAIEWKSTEEYIRLDATIWYLNGENAECRPWTEEDEISTGFYIAFTDSECQNYYEGVPHIEEDDYYIIDATDSNNYTSLELTEYMEEEISEEAIIKMENENRNSRAYLFYFSLEGNPNRVVMSGDKLGTLTITIKTAE